jgi:hypothetical protein
MRADADRARIERLLSALGRHGSTGDRIYLAGGTSAVALGWRPFTQDVDLRLEARDETPLLRAITELKDIDFALQALAKLERGLERDLADVTAMLDRRLTTTDAIAHTFEAIEPELYRFPAIDAGDLSTVVAGLGPHHSG